MSSARLLYVQKWKDWNTMEDWLVNVTELAQMTKLTCWLRERSTTIFITDWKSLMDFFAAEKKKKWTDGLWICWLERVDCGKKKIMMLAEKERVKYKCAYNCYWDQKPFFSFSLSYYFSLFFSAIQSFIVFILLKTFKIKNISEFTRII